MQFLGGGERWTLRGCGGRQVPVLHPQCGKSPNAPKIVGGTPVLQLPGELSRAFLGTLQY